MASSPIDTRVRAIILHEGKILLMRLAGSTYFCLPGGGWDAPESSRECLEREVFEELGIAWHIGGIAGVNEHRYKDEPCNELWYFVTNTEDFLDIEKLGGTHTHEFEEVHWFDLETDTVPVRPENLRDACIFWKQNGPQFFPALIS